MLVKMKPCILIVDDDNDSRKSLSRYLSRNFITLEATNGKDALKQFRNNKGIEIILSDIQMPEMAGIEMVEHLRAENRDVIVIIISALAATGIARTVIKKGANVFLPKPIDLNQLDITINTLLK